MLHCAMSLTTSEPLLANALEGFDAKLRVESKLFKFTQMSTIIHKDATSVARMNTSKDLACNFAYLRIVSKLNGTLENFRPKLNETLKNLGPKLSENL